MELNHIAQREGRLSSFLKTEMKMSTGLVNRLKWQDLILVNGKPEHNDFQVRPGDRITALLDEAEPDYPAQEGPLTILYEDKHLLAVDKPAGMLIHPSRSKNEGTLANYVLGHYRKTGQRCAVHPVTRLDRDTFGIVLLCKNSHVHALMQETPTTKEYHALVLGNWEPEEGIIDAPIARRPLPSLLRFIHPDGKPSQTHFRVLERFEGYTKLELQPITGRTHQLRLHCAHMGHPILGDPQYGTEASDFGLPHQILCAKSLHFVHPLTGEKLDLFSQLEADLKKS